MFFSIYQHRKGIRISAKSKVLLISKDFFYSVFNFFETLYLGGQNRKCLISTWSKIFRMFWSISSDSRFVWNFSKVQSRFYFIVFRTPQTRNSISFSIGWSFSEFCRSLSDQTFYYRLTVWKFFSGNQ